MKAIVNEVVKEQTEAGNVDKWVTEYAKKAAEIITRMEKLQAIVSLRTAGYCQAVYKTWFAEPEGFMEERILAHQAIRDDILAHLALHEGVTARPTDAGSYLFVQMPKLERILKQSDLFLFSVTSFADPQFEADARALTAKYGTHIYIPHGAILGLDGILDGRSGWESITIETTKNPASLGRDDQEYTVLYEGPTREACSLYPRNVNVHAAVAMAGIGFEKTHSKIISDPSVHTNTHVISVKGPGMDIQIRVSSFSEGGVTGKYTPLSACGSLHRLLDTKDVIKII